MCPLCIQGYLHLSISIRECMWTHSAFVRGRSTCQLQQSIRVGSVVGASAGGGAVYFYWSVYLGLLIGLTACHCGEWYIVLLLTS